ncbi:MAG: 8-hydroxy-5-deazaflavin:NADPH oxidoreductase [Micromonosporaceae bacterium]
MTVGIIGAGRMGRAMGAALAATGAPALLASPRRPVPRPPVRPGSGPAAAAGNLAGAPGDPSVRLVGLAELLRRAATVVLALPFPAALDTLAGGLGRAGSGRVLIDVTNPRFGPGADEWTATGVSGGERIAELAPDWLVAKAFNTVSAEVFGACRLDGMRVCVPVASDHPVARAGACTMARRLGFEPLDAGGIRTSRELESLAVLLVRIGAAQGLGSRVGVRIGVPAPWPPEVPALAASGWRSQPRSGQ